MTTANWVALYWGIGIVHTMIGMWVHREQIQIQMADMGTWWSDWPRENMTVKHRLGLLFVRFRWVVLGAIAATTSLFWPFALIAELVMWRTK